MNETANGVQVRQSYGTRIAEAEIFMAAWTGRDEDERNPDAGLTDLRAQLAESNDRELAELRDAADALHREVENEQMRRRL
jgi:hypothetical protein